MARRGLRMTVLDSNAIYTLWKPRKEDQVIREEWVKNKLYRKAVLLQQKSLVLAVLTTIATLFIPPSVLPQ
jgi:hypothetical protein